MGRFDEQNWGTSVSAVTTNESAGAFIVTLEDVLKHDADRLDAVVSKASELSRVVGLADVAETAWPALARSTRFPATFDNVTRYIASVGQIDEDLAKVLQDSQQISDAAGAGEAEKVALALSILGAHRHLHSTVRVPLVGSLGLSEALDASSITAENGQLFALLVEHDLVPDDIDTYAHVARIDWQWREQLIAASGAFKEYVTPQLVGGDLAALLASSKINEQVRLAVLDEASAYSAAADAAGRRELARCAIANGRELPVDVVEQLPSARSNAATVIELLSPHLGAIEDNRLFAILNSLGGRYAQLTSVGYDRPKIDNKPADRALLESLERRGIVSKFDPNENPIVVYKKHK